MDDDSFDTLTRSLTRAASRRRTLVVAVSAVLALLDLAPPDHATVAKSRKCQPKCNECEKCQKGDCKQKNGKKVCEPSRCTLKKNGTLCSNGRRCQRGHCSCPGGLTDCGGACVNTRVDPRNCGTCGNRCQLNAICTEGVCACVQSGCAINTASCCPAEAGIPCQCANEPGSEVFINGATCEVILNNCPDDFQPCVGPQGACQACCPPGSICDMSTGACLQ